MEKEPILEVKDLSFSYDGGTEIIKNLSFSIYKGEYVSLVGHNGSGKSTLSKLLCYLLTPNSGQIIINGTEVNEKNINLVRKSVGIVFQNPDNQFIGSSVENDIAFGLENRQVSYDEMHKIVKEFAALVGMEKYMFKSPDELSGGQKQRVAIAGILALNLKLIIFDEATSMLDPEGVEEIHKLVNKMRTKDPELTFISITHDIEEAYLSDRVMILNDGKIVKDGKPIDVFTDEDEIRSLNLDIPFVLKVKNSLKKRNIEVPSEIVTLEELADFICR